MRVAVLDDDVNQRELIERALQAIGHDCRGFNAGMPLLRALRRDRFDLLIADSQPPDIGALELLRAARVNLPERVAVLVVADRNAQADVIDALMANADDFIVAPVRAAELAARVSALLRRVGPGAASAEFSFGRFRFEVDGRRVERDGQAVTLKHKEFDLALHLFRNVGRLLTRRQLLDAVWGSEVDGVSRSLDTHASRLRTKLGLVPASGFRLNSIYGVGYRLERTSKSSTPASTTLTAAHSNGVTDSPANAMPKSIAMTGFTKV
jgi:DNA-binding response OmpR family regulator